MSEKPLLLSSAKSATLVPTAKPRNYWRMAALLCGVIVIAVGAADVSSRVAAAALGSQANLAAFGPLAALSARPIATTTPATLATSTPLVPAHLSIPSLGVSAAVEQVGKKDDGSMGTPSKFNDVAWYSLGSKPGEPGNAVIDGHVNNALTTAGVFEHLTQVHLTDTVVVSDAAGASHTYSVTSVEEYDPSASTDAIFTTTGPSQLVLITCDGEWVQDEHQFNKRLVVVAQLIK